MKYLIRSLKYFLRLCIICLVIVVVMIITEMSNLTAQGVIYVLTSTSKGLLLVGVTIFASAIYPLLGFRTRSIRYSIEKNRVQIVNAFLSEGFTIKSESKNSEMIFQAKSPMRRLTLMYEDQIKVTQINDNIEISGVGKVVARVESRIVNYTE